MERALGAVAAVGPPVHDGWNISSSWRRDYQAKPWWRDRIGSAYMSYWIYQHLGNLSPEDLVQDEQRRQVQEPGDAAPFLGEFALRADEVADGIQWSFRRTFGQIRVVVIDSRGGRVLDGGKRQMVDDAKWQWVIESVSGDWDHVVPATSVPLLLSGGLHGLEAWKRPCAPGRGASASRGPVSGSGGPPTWSTARRSEVDRQF